MKNILKKHGVEIIILSFSSLVVLALCFYCRSHSPTLGRDSLYYINLIQLWHETGSFEELWQSNKGIWIPPLYLFLGKKLVDLGCITENAAVGLNMFFACFLPWIVWGIAREVTQSVKIASCAAVLIAFNPTVITLGTEAQRDMPYLFFCGIMIYFICCAIRREKWYYWGAAGIFFALSFLTRYETLEMVIILGVYFIGALIFKKGKRLMQLLHLAILVVASVSLLWLLVSITGTTEYVKKHYRIYYDDKYELMQEKVGDFYE